jgi:hypothetical protein
MYTDYTYQFAADWFRHPETDVVILAEDMPRELWPAFAHRINGGAS